MYNLIHNNIGDPEAMEYIVNEGLLLVNGIPADMQTNPVPEVLEEGMAVLDEAFMEKGCVVARINRVAELSARIKHFVPVKDKNGDVFWEVRFGKLE